MVKKINLKRFYQKIIPPIRSMVSKIIKPLAKNRLSIPVLSIILFVLVTINFTFIKTNNKKTEDAKKSKSLVFQRQLVGANQFVGKINGVMTASLAAEDDGGKVTITRGESNLQFTVPIKNPTLSSKNIGLMQATDVAFSSKDKIIATKYSLIPNGIKEEIVMNKIPKENILPLKMNLENLQIKLNVNNIPVFYDKDGKYQFHFERPYAKDGAGNVSYGVSYQFLNKNGKKINLFEEVKGNKAKRKILSNPVPLPPSEYTIVIDIDPEWLHDSKRVLPIVIDPTVVHDETSEFSSGSMNRSKDTEGVMATGGSISFANGYTIHTFRNSGTFTPLANMNVEALVVAGGGGGGGGTYHSGGGGGGGVIYNGSVAVTPQSYSVTVGSGGAGGVNTARGSNGQDSIFATITATGGGGGGNSSTGAGLNGGSGGGNPYNYATPGTGIPGQGYGGGTGMNSVPNYGSGGGGGAGAAGGNGTSTTGGNGGNGLAFDISGTSVYYGGGGGGSTYSAGTPGSGGLGGGGAGSTGNATSGIANTGGGGGGAERSGTTGGSGGSGIVIIRYPSPSNITTDYREWQADERTLALWHMNEASGNILDSSGNGYTGTPTGTTVTSGKFGNARNFNGSTDYINLGSTFPNLTNDFTISFWVNPSSTQVAYSNLFGNHGGGGTAGMSMQQNNTTANQYFFFTGNGSTFTCWNSGAGITLTPDVWQHVALIKSSTRGIDYYLNGVLVSNCNDTTAVTASTMNLMIGQGYSGAFRPFNGLIDEFKIDSVVRSEKEIKLSASRRPYSTYESDVIDLTKSYAWNSLSWTELGVKTGDGETLKDTTGLYAQWNLNETSGTTATKDAGSCASCNGTLALFSNTSGQDVVAGSGWTGANKKWGTGALMFDGVDDFVSFGATTFDSLTTATVEMWIKYSGAFTADHVFFSRYTSATYRMPVFVSATTKKFTFENIVNGVNRSISSDTTVTPGVWYHIAFSCGSGGMKMYVNGAMQSSTNATTDCFSSIAATMNNNLGMHNGSNYFPGSIDSTRIYSRALSEAEILSNYNATNLELQTRVGDSTNPDDGTWEIWKPSTQETQIDSLDDVSAWIVNNNQLRGQSLALNKSIDTSNGNGGDGACNVTGSSVNLNTQSCSGRGTADAVSFNLSAPLGGGELSYDNGDVIHAFKETGNTALTVPAGQGRNVQVLVVAGGGGGGMDMGGGGGGGGVIYNSSYAVSSSSTVAVQVGAGGAGGPAAGTGSQPSAHQFTQPATNGQNSVFGSLTAVGGGRGGSSVNTYTPGSAGAAGGSGGGASGYNNNGVSAGGGAGTVGQGNAGGNQGSAYYSGGGGGAGAVGASGNNQANGGAGYQTSILGTSYYFGGGGGGAGYSICGGNGGAGGGGGGAVCSTTGGSGLNPGSPGGGGTTVAQTNRPGGNGGKNTGGGGGGGSHYNATNKGGDGGSGIVVVRYPYTLYPITAGDTSITLPVSPTGLAVGDEFMIINMQGNPVNNKSVGQYEIHRISAINSNTISFTDYPLRHSYDVTTQRIVLQRVPNYTNVTIGRTASGATGADSSNAGYSCLDLKNSGVNTDGTYWIDPDGSGSTYSPFQVVCNMTRDGGGWTMAVKPWYQSGAAGNTGALGTTTDATALKGNPYKLSDSNVRGIIGPSNNFDVMADQSGYNSLYSTGNFEYVILRNYTAAWDFGIGMPESSTKTQFQSYRISDNKLASTFNLKCGSNGSAGINCAPVIENNTGGGMYCDVNMGSTTNAGWHHFAMSWYNTDTYLYICNGAQHSSGQNMNHRFWVRERKPAALTVSAWDGTSGGLLAFRSNGTLTVNSTGAIVTDGLGYRGGSALGTLWNTTRSYPGESYTGTGGRCTGSTVCGTTLTQNYGGGAGSILSNGGPGGSYGSEGKQGIANNPAHLQYSGLAGTTYGSSSLDRLYLGSGGGGGGDGYNGSVWGQNNAASGVGGNGGGIIYINANSLSLNTSGQIVANGTSGSNGWQNTAVSYISGGAGGGGSGGTAKIIASSANIQESGVMADGGKTASPYYGSYGATNGTYVNNPEGGYGGIGRIAVYYSSSLTGTTNPPANTQKITSDIKIEGTNSLKIKPASMVADGVVGYWSFGQNSSTKVFQYTGADQTYTVPSGVTSINVKMWGGGGGAGYLGGWTYGYAGGGGGYTTGDIAVTPGQVLTVMVGGGGNNGNSPIQTNIYGGGARNCNTGSDCRYGGAGGGRSAVRLSGADLITAGGGGGGGSMSGSVVDMTGGGGGGTTGQAGQYSGYGNGGGGGTQGAGGAGGVGTNANGSPGTQYTGGNPSSNAYGGGGGGGWYGGGGGAYTNSNSMGGGGGGSGYIGGAGVSNASTTAASGRIQANSSDPDNKGAGAGGIASSNFYNGTPGRVIITPNSNAVATPYQEYDSSGSRNHATLVGTTLVDGINGKARNFNGTSDYILLPDNDDFDLPNTFTFEAWINPTSLASCGAVGTPTCIIANKENSYEWGIDSGGNFGWAITPSWTWVNTGIKFPAGQWNHLAIVYNGTNVIVYKNGGESVSSTAKTGTPDLTTFDLRIGNRATAGAYFFSGKMDEVSLSRVARSAEEVSESYRMGKDYIVSKTIPSTDLTSKHSIPFYIAADRPGTYLEAAIGETDYAVNHPDDNTIALWHMDERYGANPMFKDATDNGYDLNIWNSPTYVEGKIGSGRLFSAAAQGLYHLSFAQPTTFTIEGWVKPTSAALDGANWHTIAGWEYDPNNLNGIWIYNNKFRIWSVEGATSDSNTTLSANQWYHVAFTYSGGTRKVYVNGQLDSTTSLGFTANTDDFYLGARSSTLYPSSSVLDEFRVSKVERSADEIRQAYEAGLRSHPITIDFAAKLDSGNLIADNSDLSFTIDATAYGANNLGSNLYKGEKVIVREYYDGTEYVAQGTVSAINVGTGATTVVAWDSGATFPPGGYTVNASVFKWQREYWNITEPLDSYLNGTTKITLRMTNNNEARTVWVDDIKSAGDGLTDPAGSTITSTTGKRYFQYRIIETSSDENVSSSISSVTLDYDQNTAPNTPTLNSPTDTQTNRSLTPALQTTTTDINSDNIQYKIELCEDLAMTTNCQTFDQNSSQSGWSGQNGDSGTTYTSGTAGTYTISTPLSSSTTYYWRSYAIDPAGLNQWSATQVTPYSFTTSTAPSSPSTPYSEGASNPSGVTDTTPEFSAVQSDPDGDSANYYQVEVNTQSDFLGTSMWDSGKTSMTTTANGVRSPDIAYAGSAIPMDGAGTTYYWRIKFWDVNGVEGSYTTAQSFTMNTKPGTPTLDAPLDTSTGQSMVPALQTTVSDTDSDYLRYKIELCTNVTMTQNCQTFDQTLSQTGWSGQNAQTSTAYVSGSQASYTLQTPLDPLTTYYWRSYAIDPEGSNLWSETQATPYSFTTTATNAPTQCRVELGPNASYLTVKWNDNSSTEANYEVKKSTDGGGFSTLQTLPANSVNHQDSSVARGHSYQYQVAALFPGDVYSQWCTTSVVNLPLEGNVFSIN